MRRNLCDNCKSCPDNDKSIPYCFDVCEIPYRLLEDHEAFRDYLDIRRERLVNGSKTNL